MGKLVQDGTERPVYFMDYSAINVAKITDYLRQGCKPESEFALGVEIEHFVVGDTEETVSYERVAEFLRLMMGIKNTAYLVDGHLLGYTGEDYNITLEPGAQLEISIKPQKDPERVREIYRAFRKRADRILAMNNLHLVNMGYHPFAKASDIKIIPKKRYAFMDRYFRESDTMGSNMMRATASTQISIDYSSEDDFVLKFRLANALSPIIASMFSNVTVFEGKSTDQKMMRTKIWNHVDRDRCGTPMISSFKDYAERVYFSPAILVPDNRGSFQYTGNKTFHEIYAGREMTDLEVEHALSMFFFDVRGRKYIEIRMADSMEIDRVMEYVHFISQVFYTNVRYSLYENMHVEDMKEDDIVREKKRLMGNDKSILSKLNRRYMELVKSKRDENVITARIGRDYLQASTAKYHGRCVRTLYAPKIFTKDTIKFLSNEIRTLYSIFERVYNEFYNNAAYRKLFGFDAKLEELMLQETGYSSRIPIARIDLFLNEETMEYKFCEFNTDGTSAMNEDRELNNTLKLTKAYQEFSEEYKVESAELFDSWVDTFQRIYASYDKAIEKPNVVITDFMENATENEFLIFKKTFEEHGFCTEICEIRDLKYVNGKLMTPSGMRVDAIYRRAVTSDIMNHFDEVSDFIQAVKEDAVCLIGGFQTQLVHNKILFLMLHHEATRKILTAKQNEFVKAHVPYTEFLTRSSELTDDVLAQKDKWIIKPTDSYGSRGVYAGTELSEDEWIMKIEQAMDTGYLVQEFQPPYVTINLDLYHDEEAEPMKCHNLTGVFVYDGKVQGIYSRVSRTEMISTQYSEIALPTIYVSVGKNPTATPVG